jgi:hypothetical protein
MMSGSSLTSLNALTEEVFYALNNYGGMVNRVYSRLEESLQ